MSDRVYYKVESESSSKQVICGYESVSVAALGNGHFVHTFDITIGSVELFESHLLSEHTIINYYIDE